MSFLLPLFAGHKVKSRAEWTFDFMTLRLFDSRRLPLQPTRLPNAIIDYNTNIVRSQHEHSASVRLARRVENAEPFSIRVGCLLVKYGYRKMTVEDIAHEAGIGKGNMNRDFSNKEEVALGWFDRSHGRTEDILRIIARSDLKPDLKLPAETAGSPKSDVWFRWGAGVCAESG